MKEFLKQKPGLVMVIVGSVLLASDLSGIEIGLLLPLGLVLIVEGISRD